MPPPETEIVLCNTRHAGNIGAVARLMKNLDITRLKLVNPTSRVHIDAIRMAVGAEEILERVMLFESLESALVGSDVSFAVTGRKRRARMEICRPENCLEKTGSGRISFVFGSEKFGLSNDEISLCSYLLMIPVSLEHTSYNLAQAVAIVLYAACHDNLRKPVAGKKARRKPPEEPELEKLYQRIDETARLSGFYNRAGHEATSRQIRNIFARSRLDRKDVKILLGLYKQFQRKMGNNF